MSWKIKRAGKTLPVRPTILFMPRPRRQEALLIPVRCPAYLRF